MSRVASVARALPGPAHAQADITATIAPLVAPEGSGRALMEKVHGSSGVRTRHLALPLDGYAGLTDFGAANDLFREHATALATQAARDALEAAGLAPDDVDHVWFTSVTGLAAPSVDALVAARLGLRPDVRRTPSFGLGCGGGAAGLGRVHDYLVGHPADVALLVAVELCSLTLQHGDASPANLVASGLFGDGAAAAVVVGRDHVATGPEIVSAASRLYPGTEDVLGWEIGSTGFRIVLAPGLPGLVETHVAADVEGLLAAHDLKVEDVEAWVVHAGGPRILDAVGSALRLPAAHLDPSRASLSAVGNLSSASVLDVLARVLDDPPAPGAPGVVLAFGPGVSAELVLLRWPTEV